MFSMFLSSVESLGVLKKAVGTQSDRQVFPQLSCSPNLPLVFL